MNRFLQGTLVLLISGIILKILGFIYQIYIVRTVGTEALGLVNMVHPYYISLVILATMGMPTAISRLVAAKEAEEKNTAKIMRVAFTLVLSLGTVLIAAALIFMPPVFDILGFDRRLRWCFYILLPGVIIVPLSSVMRGYFQGRRQMLFPSVGQIAEQLSRILLGGSLIYCFKNAYQGYLALFLCAATISGEFCGLFILSIFYIRTRFQEKNPPAKDSPAKEMLSLGIPVTLTRLTSSADLMAEAWILPRGLKICGASSSESAALYGRLNSVCFGLISLPAVATNALATMLLPSVAALCVTDTAALRKKCADSVLLTCMFALPIAAILYQNGGAIIELIYHLQGLDDIIKVLSIGAVFIYLGQTAVGILQGLGKNKAVFFTNLSGSLAKIVLLWLFVWHLQGGILGAAWAFGGAYFLQCLLDLLLLKYYVNFKISLIKFCGTLILSGGVWFILPMLTDILQIFCGAWAVLIAPILSGTVYLLLMSFFGLFSRQMLS